MSNVIKALCDIMLWVVGAGAAIFVMKTTGNIFLTATVLMTAVCMVATIALLFGDLPVDRRTRGR